MPAAIVALPLLAGALTGLVISDDTATALSIYSASGALLALLSALGAFSVESSLDAVIAIATGCLLAGLSLGVTSAFLAYHPPLLQWFEARASQDRSHADSDRRNAARGCSALGSVAFRRRRRAERRREHRGRMGIVGEAGRRPPVRRRGVRTCAARVVAGGPPSTDLGIAPSALDLPRSRSSRRSTCARAAGHRPGRHREERCDGRDRGQRIVRTRAGCRGTVVGSRPAWQRRRQVEREIGGGRDCRADRRPHRSSRCRYASPAGCRDVSRDSDLGREHRDSDGPRHGRAQPGESPWQGRSGYDDRSAPRLPRNCGACAVGAACDQRRAPISLRARSGPSRLDAQRARDRRDPRGRGCAGRAAGSRIRAVVRSYAWAFWLSSPAGPAGPRATPESRDEPSRGSGRCSGQPWQPRLRSCPSPRSSSGE